MIQKNIPEEIVVMIDSLKRVTKFVIIHFETLELNVKQRIIRNFVAKTHSLLNSIYLLVRENQESEAIALYRLLIERYFYLEYLEKNNSYQSFKDWSYVKTYESRNKMRSGSSFNDEKTKKFLVDDKEQIRKYQELKKKGNSWIEPKLEVFAKEIDMSFLYSLGYDTGSSSIHPRADEGLWDAKRIVKNESIIDFKRDNILKNTILISNALIIFGLNHSQVDFGKYLNYYCNSIFEYLNGNIDLPDLVAIEKIFYASLIED